MKYSFLMPYIDRAEQLRITLQSFERLYKRRGDFEIVLVVDPKCTAADESNLYRVLDSFPAFNFTVRRLWDTNITNPAPAYNQAYYYSKGEYLILTSPEIRHETDVLFGLDEWFKENINYYIVCACQSLDEKGRFKKWFQHTEHRNNGYHFCSAILKENFEMVGKFDEQYAYGIAFEDDDFRNKIMVGGLQTICDDMLITSHQHHQKHKPVDYRQKHERNKKIFEEKWRK